VKPLKKATLILLSTSVLFSVANGLIWPYITVNMYLFESNYLEMVFVDAFPALSYILSRIWGSISDYYGRRKPFMALGFLLGAIPLAFAGIAGDLYSFILLILISNFFYSIGYPSFYAALGRLGGREIYGLLEALSSIGWMVGAGLLGYVHAYWGGIGVYLTAATIILLSIAIILILYREEREKRGDYPSLIDYLRDSLKLRIRADPLFKYVLIAAFIAWISTYWNGPLLKIKLYLLMEESVGTYGLVMGLGAGLLSALGALLVMALARKYGGLPLLTFGLLAYSLFYPILGLVSSPLIFSVVFITPVWPFFYIGQLASTHELSIKDFEAENMGTLLTVTSFSAIPALTGGLIADAMGLDLAIAITGVLEVIAFSMMVLCLRKRRSASP